MSRVTLTNPFDLLTDENEDRTNVPQPKKEQKPAAPATAKPAAKPAATGAAKSAPKPEAAKAPAKPAAAKPATGNSAPQTVKPAPPRDSNQNLQERDKETRAPRDSRDRVARPAGDKKGHASDRKSGTGRIKNEQSRGGRGRGNWGEADAKEGAEALKEKEDKPEKEEAGDDTEKVTVVEGEKKEGDVAAKVETTSAAPVDEVTFTYDEWLEKKGKGTKLPQVEAFKPRTVTDTDFAGFVPLQREENGAGAAAPKDKKKPASDKPAAEKPADKNAAEKAAAEKKERNLAAELLKFASHSDRQRQERSDFRRQNYGEERRGDDRRGDRGTNDKRGRGNGPRGSPRPDNKQPGTAAAQPPVQEKDFPTLGPHGSNPVKA